MRRSAFSFAIIVFGCSAFALPVSVSAAKTVAVSSKAAVVAKPKVVAKKPVVKKAAPAKKTVTPAAPKKVAAVQSSCQKEGIANVDIAEVRRVWLSWINKERQKAGLVALLPSPALNDTASLWSKQAAQKGSISHKRPGQTVYYDYARMVKWFLGLGVAFANEDRSTFSESIGYGTYKCSVKDCTQELIESMRSTFDFYMAEKGKKSAPHYNSIMNKSFKKAGLGIAINPDQKTYYVTTHYGTTLEAPKPTACL